MKRILKFIVNWTVLFLIVFGALNMYSDSLYSDFLEMESECNEQQGRSQESFSEECMIENILYVSENDRTPIQREVVKSHQSADGFNIVLLVGGVIWLVLSGVASWFLAYNGKRKNA